MASRKKRAVKATKTASPTRWDESHGSWYDRGAADNYGREPNPHRGGVGGDSGPLTPAEKPDEVEASMAGYRQNQKTGAREPWD